MNVDGSSQTRLTSNSATEVAPAWSPDGTKIAFDSDRDGNREIYTINSDGSNPVRLTSNAASDSDPNWSPNGTALAFVSNRDGNFEIDSMNADGSNVTNLTRNTAFDADPAWSPDGSMITFTTNRNGLNEIAVMNADGSGETVISTGSDGFPDWQPIALTLVSAASSKKQGNAGTFDIDLPLSGTQGVECRQGALGTATNIVFTFSGTVNSVDSTSTSCGRVISTTASGSTVSVLLKDIQTSCDGLDVTLTLTGVNGDSDTLASAAVTFGMLAGDINGDGTVDGNDLHSVRSNSGRGLVTDANFRNDVSADGKVNHADISLTKAARGNSLP